MKISERPNSGITSNTVRHLVVSALMLGGCDISVRVGHQEPARATSQQNTVVSPQPVSEPECDFVRLYGTADYPLCSQLSREVNGGSCAMPECLHMGANPGESDEATLRREVRGYCALLTLSQLNGRHRVRSSFCGTTR